MSNIGDVAVFSDNPTATRESVVNAYSGGQLRTIYPGELVKTGAEDQNFQFYLYYHRNDPFSQGELTRLRYKYGYDFVKREEWTAKNEAWHWDEKGHLQIAGHTVMYRPEAMWRASQEERRRRAEGIVGEGLEKFKAKADQYGMKVQAEEIEDADAPRRGRRK